MILTKNESQAFWICAVITSINAVVGAGFSIAAVIANGGVYAMYGASRSVALVLAVATVLVLRSPVGVAAMAVTMVLVQLFDAVIGLLSRDTMKTIGPLVLAMATLLSLLPLLRGIRNRFIQANG